MIVLLHGEVVKHAISVQTHMADGLPLVQGDRVQLQQVILNLIVNAIQAMRRRRRRTSGTADQHPNSQLGRRAGHGAGHGAGAGSCQSSSLCSTLSIRPSRMVWAWACRSAARSSRSMAGGYGPRRITTTARPSSSSCPLPSPITKARPNSRAAPAKSRSKKPKVFAPLFSKSGRFLSASRNSLWARLPHLR